MAAMEDKFVYDLMYQLYGRGFHVLYYKSWTTHSFYIKLDYGAGHSIRVSDHPGKKHLKYKFNLRTDLTGNSMIKDGDYHMHTYGMDTIKKMIDHAVSLRKMKIFKYGRLSYNRIIADNKRKVGCAKGFWKSCEEFKAN